MTCPKCGFYQHWFKTIARYGLGLPIDITCPKCGSIMEALK